MAQRCEGGHFMKSKIPLISPLIDYIDSSFIYLRHRSFAEIERFQIKPSPGRVSGIFLACVCAFLGLLSSIKFEVVTLHGKPISNDLHLVLMSSEDKLYTDEIDTSRVMWCIETSDCIVMLISCLLILNSGSMRSPLSEYLFLPWLGATVRGLLLRQAPTVCALMYTVAVVNGTLNPLFLITFIFMFLLEARLWMEIARLVNGRWNRRFNANNLPKIIPQNPVETLWTNDDAPSFEVRNYVY